MDSFQTISNEDYNNQLDQWEKSLRLELKLEDLNGKTTKKLPEGVTWPILSTECEAHFVPSAIKWKKAAQTYMTYPENVDSWIQDDVLAGVKVFFFESRKLTSGIWEKIKKSLEQTPDLNVFILGHFDPGPCYFSVVSEKNMITGRQVHEEGGHNVMELAFMTKELTLRASTSQSIDLALFIDSSFFQNIAKIRACRLLANKVLGELGLKKEVKVIALTSFREWTLFERYSNMLRNDVAIASAYIAGADYVQSSGYQSLFEIELDLNDSEHAERSRRMARNTSHILGLESMLGTVDDAASGSYHIESLTNFYAEEAWKLMQKMLTDGDDFLKSQCETLRTSRLDSFRKRKHILSGINDFADVKEILSFEKKPKTLFFRLARDFEELRLNVNQLKSKPKVYVALLGDLAVLNDRLNFVKNYFEVLGLQVITPLQSQFEIEDLSNRKEEVIVFCAKDEDYPRFSLAGISNKELFVAGKVKFPGVQNIFSGQDIYQILLGLAARLGAK